jgi:TPP-dependent indolepyruvate ferredoxin oxidoreductase alpha subunit
MGKLLKNSLQRLLRGNEAMGLGIVEGGCTLAASYHGT